MSSIMGDVSMNFGWAVLYALFAGLGFTLIMVIMSGMREKLNNIKVSKYLAGFPISMVTAAFICMAFTVFSYIV
jgi:electron transport complex protein RnfA